MRAGGKLIYGEARRAPDGVWVVALHDLTPGQVRLMETLQRETFRSLVEKKPVSFVLLESPQVTDGILRHLPVLRQGLGTDEQAGPYDATRVGIVLSGVGSAAMIHLALSAPGIDADTYPCDIIGPLFYEEDVLSKPLLISGGIATLPDRPGLSVEFDEENVEKYRVR